MNELVKNKIMKSSWTDKALIEIIGAIRDSLFKKGECSLMITGGRAAHQLYSAWAAIPEYLSLINQVQIYFGDERYIPCDHPDSNFLLFKSTFFPQGLPQDVSINKMYLSGVNIGEAADVYAARLPEKIDVLLLSVGDDGHIASLFPFSESLGEMERRVVPFIDQRIRHPRLTITPQVVLSAENVFVLAIGDVKETIFKKLLDSPLDILSLPARLVLGRKWILNIV